MRSTWEDRFWMSYLTSTLNKTGSVTSKLLTNFHWEVLPLRLHRGWGTKLSIVCYLGTPQSLTSSEGSTVLCCHYILNVQLNKCEMNTKCWCQDPHIKKNYKGERSFSYFLGYKIWIKFVNQNNKMHSVNFPCSLGKLWFLHR